MSKAINKAEAGAGAFFVIGLVFTVIGMATDSTFLIIGIVFLVTGLCGWGYARTHRKDGADEIKP